MQLVSGLCIDCDETFNLVVKLATIHIVLSLAVSKNGLIHEVDVKNDFFMVIYRRLFICINHMVLWTLIILIYVEELLERTHMLKYNPCRTPIDTDSKFGRNGDLESDPTTLYQSLADGRNGDLDVLISLLCIKASDALRFRTFTDMVVVTHEMNTLDWNVTTTADPAGHCLRFLRFRTPSLPDAVEVLREPSAVDLPFNTWVSYHGIPILDGVETQDSGGTSMWTNIGVETYLRYAINCIGLPEEEREGCGNGRREPSL
ncbi:ribonuclease H-like domain-containing protein [Tanacetum coccineum]